VRRRVRKSRQKEAAGAADAVLMQIEWRERGLLKLSGCSMSVAEEPTRMDQGEARLKRNLLWGMKKLSSGDGDTLRRDARKRADSALCGRVISCSHGHERWRTELELCCCEAFDDGHRSAALGTTP